MIPKLTWLIIISLFTLPTFASSSHNLTHSFAKARRAQIAKVAYEVKFSFSEDRAYTGNVRIKLSLNETTKPLVLDSQAEKIKKIVINGNEIKEYSHSAGVINIPAKFLAKETLIDIDFSAQVGSASFIWFVDPQDNKKYFYTNLEPFGLNEVFPCFDQPDLKATFQVSLKGPKDWTFIANENASSSKITGQFVEVSFPETPLISPYLFFIGGGHYVEFSDEYEGLPLKIYARHSLKESVDEEVLFDLTKRGLTFFKNFFDYPYPFSKYGHVFVPDFGSSGMENPGAVTINEKFIFPDKVPQSYYQKRENLIFHEMAHIWFGDLVTMKWWNDLWLNESFATFMSYLAQERIFNDKGRWIQFESAKLWAMQDDEKSSTHPILSLIPDLITAESGFDGITYGKGAASLKQLFFYAGEDSFKNGLRSYFKKFAFQNTELKDFIEAIDEYSPKDLTKWGNQWFKTKGLNKILVNFDCQNNKISHFEVLQSPAYAGNLTPHKTIFNLYLDSGSDLRLMESVTLEYSKSRTNFSQLVGKKCPDFIMPNAGSHDYGVFTLDERSRKLRKRAIAELPDSISRLQLWMGLKQDVESGVIKAAHFFEVAMHALKNEKDGHLLSLILGVQNSVLHIIRDPFLHYLTPAERMVIAPKLERILFNRIINAEHFSDLKSALFNLYLLSATTPLSQKRLYRFLVKNDNLRGITLSQEVRWEIILNLAYNNHPKARELITLERKRDHSFQGQVYEYSAKASLPALDLKKELWPKQLRPWELSYTVVEQGARYIHHPDHPEMSLPFLENYFKTLEKTDWNVNSGYVWYYLNLLFPHPLCSEEVVNMSKRYMKKAKLNSYAQRMWADNHEKLVRCVRIRKMSSPLVVR